MRAYPLGCIGKVVAAQFLWLTQGIFALLFYHVSLGLCYSSLREVERMRPFNRCFGCAMNIKGLGYPYEKFAICIRPISPCYPFVIRIVDKIQNRNRWFSFGCANKTRCLFTSPPFCSRSIERGPTTVVSGRTAVLHLVRWPKLVGFSVSFHITVSKNALSLGEIDKDRNSPMMRLLLCTRRSDSGFVQRRIDDTTLSTLYTLELDLKLIPSHHLLAPLSTRLMPFFRRQYIYGKTLSISYLDKLIVHIVSMDVDMY